MGSRAVRPGAARGARAFAAEQGPRRPSRRWRPAFPIRPGAAPSRAAITRRGKELSPMTLSLPQESIGSDERGRRRAPARFREGWLHLCNGLDPVRDGGMVPSILGMTGALASQQDGRPLTIVTPTPSRLGTVPLPPRVNLRGPET